MQKLVGTADYEHYSTLGPAERFDEHYSIKPIDRIQRYVIVGYFNLFNFSSSTWNILLLINIKFKYYLSCNLKYKK